MSREAAWRARSRVLVWYCLALRALSFYWCSSCGMNPPGRLQQPLPEILPCRWARVQVLPCVSQSPAAGPSCHARAVSYPQVAARLRHQVVMRFRGPELLNALNAHATSTGLVNMSQAAVATAVGADAVDLHLTRMLGVFAEVLCWAHRHACRQTLPPCCALPLTCCHLHLGLPTQSSTFIRGVQVGFSNGDLFRAHIGTDGRCALFLQHSCPRRA